MRVSLCNSLQSALKKLSSLAFRSQGLRRRGSPLSSSPAFEVCEQRIVPTVDLRTSVLYLDFIASATVPNQYTTSFDFTLFNNGTTSANLTGNKFDLSDNVRLKVVLSSDQVQGNSDDVEIGAAIISGPTTDNTTISLASQSEKTFHVSGTFSADPNYRYVFSIVDSTNVLVETDEANNVTMTDLSVFNPVVRSTSTADSIPAGPAVTLDNAMYLQDLITTAFDKSTITVTNTNAKPGDLFNIARGTFNGETLKKAGSSLKLGKEVIGSVSGGKGAAPLLLSFNDQANNLMITKTLQQITFKAKNNELGQREFKVKYTSPVGASRTTTFSRDVKSPKDL
ncbi:MAG: hypothetical protein U0903_14740 [Planctomycetales bacterium]